MEREERYKRSAARDMREVNRDSIIFLLLLDTGQKVIPIFSELQVLGNLSSQLFFILYFPSIIL